MSAVLSGRESTWTIRRSDLVTVVSEGMRRAIVERSGIPPERVLVATTGVNPDLVETIPPWSPPGPDDVVTLAYLGSPYDVERGRLLGGVQEAGTRARRRLKLRLATELPAGISPPGLAVEVRPSRYADFAGSATTVDVWLNCFDPADRYIMEMGSPIKLPMCLASGRPTVTTSGPYLDWDGLTPWTVTAVPTGNGLELAILSVLADMPAAARRARAAREHMLQTRQWIATATSISEHLDAMASTSRQTIADPRRSA